MDYLTEKEVRSFKQDVQYGAAKQNTEKMLFEKRLLEGLGEEMIEEINNPTSRTVERKKSVAKKLTKKKRCAVWKENLRHILGLTKKETD